MKWEIFDMDTQPDMEIALAIRMSCCYPYFLTQLNLMIVFTLMVVF